MNKWKARLEDAMERKLTYRDKEGDYADRCGWRVIGKVSLRDKWLMIKMHWLEQRSHIDEIIFVVTPTSSHMLTPSSSSSSSTTTNQPLSHPVAEVSVKRDKILCSQTIALTTNDHRCVSCPHTF